MPSDNDDANDKQDASSDSNSGGSDSRDPSAMPDEYSTFAGGDNGPKKETEKNQLGFETLPGDDSGHSGLDLPQSQQIGPYKLLKKIGEGGMGSVYLAEQEQPIRRRVALKLIRTDRGSSQIISRFDAERQALAMMDHPNIAKVLDAGETSDGTPYFAMELVNGVPFTKYCDDNRLSIRERLELFIPVCEAVQHAHQKGIVHRDLKPSNVLVGLYDDKPVPKVIDFGLAKALEQEQRLTDKSLFTEFGAVVGTLQYMSPEQAEPDQLDIDTRTDIYSLGVMLYELLTGSTPIDKETMNQQAILKVLQFIREKEPPRPSTRLSDSGDAITGVSNHRRIDPRQLAKILRGELDWIVMKSLEKDRERRYATASAFADDLSRYLNNEAIVARPPSLGYRIQKTFKRHRAAVLTSAAFLAILVGGLVVITNLYFRSERLASENQRKSDDNALLAAERDQAAKQAQEEAANQRAATEFLFEVFGAGDPVFGNIVSSYGAPIGEKTTVGQLALVATQTELRDRISKFVERPKLRAEVLHGLADINISIGNFELARRALNKAESLIAEDDRSTASQQLGKVLTSQALLDYVFGDLKTGRERLERAKPILVSALASAPDDRGILRELQDCRMVLGATLVEYYEHDAAIAEFQEMGEIEPGITPEASLQSLVGKLFSLTTRIDQLEIDDQPTTLLLPQLIPLVVRFGIERPFNDNIAVALGHAGTAQFNVASGNKLAALQNIYAMHRSFQDTLGKEHILNCMPLFLAMNLAIDEDQHSAAIDASSELLELIDTNLGVRQHPRLCQILTNRGKSLFRRSQNASEKSESDLAAALESLDEAIQIGSDFFGEEHWRVGDAFRYRARVRIAQGDLQPAADDLRKSLQCRVSRYGADSPKNQNIRFELINALESIGELDEAKLQAEKRVQIHIASEEADTGPLGFSQLNLARITLNIHRRDQTLNEANQQSVIDLLNQAIANAESGSAPFQSAAAQAAILIKQLVENEN